MKNLIALFLLTCLTVSSYGQITVESNTLPEVGDILNYINIIGFEDTTAYRQSGEDVVWTFDNLVAGMEMDEFYVDITTTDLADSFPTAEMLINLGPFVGAATRSTNRLNVVGVSARGFGGFDFDAAVRLSDDYVLRETPLTFGTQNDDDVEVLVTLDASVIPGLDSLDIGLPGGIDSIRVIVELDRSEEVIGWGTVNIENEEPAEALQVLEVTSSDFSIEVGVDFLGALLWIDVTDVFGMGLGFGGAQTTNTYRFITEDRKRSLIEFSETEVPDAQGNTMLVITGRIGADLITSTEDISFSEANMTLFPNPVSESLIIAGDNNNTSYQISIWNMQGQLIQQNSSYQLGDQMDVSLLENGYYSIRLSNDDESTVAKFYKVR